VSRPFSLFYYGDHSMGLGPRIQKGPVIPRENNNVNNLVEINYTTV